MGMITAAVTIQGKPLRKAYVERTGLMGSEGFTMTDNNGSFTFDGGLFNQIDVKIYCQNPVLRVLDGANSNYPVSFSAKARNGASIAITRQKDHYRILNTCLEIYETVWRQFKPYSDRRGFPLKKLSKLSETFKRRIELSYPDNFPSDLAFVEPSGVTNDGYPLVHVKDRKRDGRLFGEGDDVSDDHDASLLPHELGHVFHFSALTGAGRAAFQAAYLLFLIERTVRTGDAYHEVEKPTSAFVAYVEAVGIFSERFFLFKKLVQPGLTGRALREAFVADELSNLSTLSKSNGPLEHPQVQVGRRGADGVITPLLMGDNVEGAVYGAIYLDFASRIGMLDAVELMLTSGADSFDGFRRYVSGRNVASWKSAIDAVKETWKL